MTSINYHGFRRIACVAIASLAFAMTLAMHADDGIGPVRVNRGEEVQTAQGEQTLHQLVNQALHLELSTMLTLDIDTTPEQDLTVSFPINGVERTIHVTPHSVRSPSYRLLAQVDGELIEMEAGPIRTLRGVVQGVPGSSARGSISDDGLTLMVKMPGLGRTWLEPVDMDLPGAKANDYVLYHADDVQPFGLCGVHDDEGNDNADDTPQAGGGVAGMSNCFFITEIGCDADFEFYTGNNSSIPSVESKINAVINGVNDQYEDDVEIHHAISVIIVRTEEPDPYSSSDGSTLLGQFRSHWNSQVSDPHDVAQLFTGKDISTPGQGSSTIGIASVQAICTSFAYGVVEDFGVGSCAADLSAHELGHNWSAGHCGCPGFTMNSSLTCANQFTGASISSITNYRNSRPCLSNDCIATNDDCNNAILISNGATSFSTELTTTDGPADVLCDQDGDSQVGSDIWYRYVPDCDGAVTASLCGSNFDTRLAIYQALSCPTIISTALACNDDSCGLQSEITFDANGGQHYYIRVGGFEDAQGSGSLTISSPNCVPAPANDACGAATFVLLGDSSVDTVGATTDGSSEACGLIANDAWYRYFNVEGTETITFSVDSNFATSIAIYGANCPGGADEAIACSSGDTVTVPAAIQFYRIRVGSNAGETGTGTLNISVDLPPSCPTDTDGNGQTDVDDLVTVILAWGSADADADVNGSGMVDVDDLVQVILEWGPC